MYETIVRREGIQAIELQRSNMIAAVFTNPTWDDPKNDRQAYLEELHNNFNRAIEILSYGDKREPEIDWDNPFYAAARRNLEKTRQKISVKLEGKPMKDHIDMSEERLEARLQSRKGIDQLP
jgi:DNA polymerase III delta prime subunit